MRYRLGIQKSEASDCGEQSGTDNVNAHLKVLLLGVYSYNRN